ncbi:succinate-semialdehyde dehydrogenase [NADP(+)] 1 [Deinococcus seoulensis]|uniref:Succinate-semialdehyde dehydrogenase [NADP(+)] 1 n=1 Tax=Deinococcus seoulensis TaxID=1837379 RepID=A0ABQ2RR81_9DEIO|nr:NAD-dependent succinate-semialdehyde dehydrogenase [Deinococcus seoulensis]GGR58066.1 succinate-semialdehyde dehydrogenase [NADP(+)] 1 [Deinococcus seoulensis]
MQSVNPATGETFATYDEHTTEQVQAAIAAAHTAYGEYRRTTFEQRSAWMNAAADVLARRAGELALLATQEMGKTLEAARQEVLKCASACRYYAEHAGAFLAPEPVQTEADEAFVTHQPLGVVLAVMPWNFPYWQAFRFIAPTLMAGNTGLLKHASNVPGCALAIEDVLREAGFPAGVFTTLLIGSRDVEAVLKDPRVTAVSLTGSEGAGRAVSATAGGELKPAVMELGGSDPFIVMPSADIELAAKTAVTARTINNGQSCIAAKRFIVHSDVYDAFTDAFVAGLEALKVGNPELEDTDVGPLATPQIREDIHKQVQDAVSKGARVRTGGQLPQGPGNYYPVTALDGLTPDMDVWLEETFGPVALIFRVQSLDEAVELANTTTFGLGSSAWTNDTAERERFIADLEAGSVFINSMVASDPRLPFGGVKNSGFGRELGRHGILQFVNIKTVSIGAPDGAHRSKTE